MKLYENSAYRVAETMRNFNSICEILYKNLFYQALKSKILEDFH